VKTRILVFDGFDPASFASPASPDVPAADQTGGAPQLPEVTDVTWPAV